MANIRKQTVFRVNGEVVTKFGTLRPGDQIMYVHMRSKVICKKNRVDKVEGYQMMDLEVDTPLGRQTVQVAREDLVPIVKLVAETLPKRDPHRQEIKR